MQVISPALVHANLGRHLSSSTAAISTPLGSVYGPAPAGVQALRNSKDEPGKPGPKVVKNSPNARIDHHDFDVVVCGGTLGLLLATTLQLRGHSVRRVAATRVLKAGLHGGA
jgi:hypothetical protein